ncbi:FG-GAP repeat [Fuerstiella marisgermanici]|uniref:FG-GAP repeat n=2 Tax=Fuerstiella marisgermanici TaxID=1891926 RepID=A0A1P8W9Z0_9PLAN|nr:FG-GAP repeat [Fuerstiella marisgermanici]
MRTTGSSQRSQQCLRGAAYKVLVAFCSAAALGVQVGCQQTSEDPSQRSKAVPLFREVAASRGIDWIHNAGPHDDFPMPQIMGSGCALFDANGDGLLDVLLVPGHCPPESLQEENSQVRTAVPLFLQSQDGMFVEHTGQSGMVIRGFGMGATTGDIDNDGDVDVLLTTSTGPLLFTNNGDATFEDVTGAAGIESSRWSAAAAFTDYDRDGWLDLLVVNYVDYFPGSICEDGVGNRDYCGPLSFTGTTDRLYRNLGADGSPGAFHDATIPSGIVTAVGKGLGLICSDLTGDGRIDFYVANDMEPNRLWVQQENLTFVDEAPIRGCATDIHGRAQASMGCVWTDLDSDGRNDILLTHLRGENNTVYRQVAPGLFADQTGTTGLGAASLDFTGFGVATPDLDCDGFLDVVIANGRVKRAPLLNPVPASSHWAEYAERNQIFFGSNDGLFQQTLPRDEPFTKDARISRGLATGDIDNDGDIDVLVVNTNGPCEIFENIVPKAGHWLMVRAMDGRKKRDAVGAMLTLVCKSATWRREVQPNSGYQSSHDARVHFGTGEETEFEYVEVEWPDGACEIERFEGGPLDRHILLIRGNGSRGPGG